MLLFRRLPFTNQKAFFSLWSDRVSENQPHLTKIVATIGPASESPAMLQNIVSAGMRVMRINFSHATYEESDLRINTLRSMKGVHGGAFNLRAVLLDTQGPEIRTGCCDKDYFLEKGNKVTVTTDEAFANKCSPEKIYVTYKSIAKSLQPGGKVLLDDGLVSLIVKSISDSGDVQCVVENSGEMSNKKGVNLPGAKIDLPAMSLKDKADIEYGVKNDVDFIAASFVRKASDIRAIREFITPLTAKYHSPSHPVAKIIAKVESTEAIENFDEILEESDGIMVARGDLGVEIPIAQLTNAQKTMVEKCNLAGKPVIVATQMLESMQKNPRPTRAEVADVTNAVHDGADAVMLSGESAKGKYPLESVQMMNSIIEEAERWISTHGRPLVIPVNPSNHLESVCNAAVQASNSMNAVCIIVLTRKGTSAETVAKYRPNCPIMAFTPSPKVGRQLMLRRGVHPVVVDSLERDNKEIISMAIAKAKDHGFASTNSNVVLVCAEPGNESMHSVVSFRAIRVK